MYKTEIEVNRIEINENLILKIQTINPPLCINVNRSLGYEKYKENYSYIRSQTIFFLCSFFKDEEAKKLDFFFAFSHLSSVSHCQENNEKEKNFSGHV